MLLKWLKEMENIVPHTDMHTSNWYWTLAGIVMSHIPSSSNLVPSDFHLIGLIKKQQAGK
jgi:hypothetical protein